MYSDALSYLLKYAKKSRSTQYIFVNNRSIKSQFINHSIFSSFEGLLREGFYPGYFLFINMDKAKIDVNVHPNKTEIKFDDDQHLYSIINSAVKQDFRTLEKKFPKLTKQISALK